jgi:hypothetical protein
MAMMMLGERKTLRSRNMKKRFFFGAVIFFLVSLFMFFFGLVSPRFVGVVTKPAGLMAVRQVEQRNVTANVVRVVNTATVVSVVEDVHV